MDLKTYLELKNISQKEFAEMIGVRASTISNYICKRRFPTLKIGAKIEKATRGNVSITDLLGCKEKNDGKKDLLQN